MNAPALALVALSLALPTLAGAAPAAFTPENAPEALRPALTRADEAIRALQLRLQARLVAAMKDGGPAAAVGACRDDAARLTAEAALDQGVSVGRTSDRLRNPANAAPAWAEAAVRAAAGKKASEVQGAVFDLGDRVGVLRPIPVRNTCAACHGGPEAIPAAVRETVGKAYPADRAVGYAEGDHRGFAWAEVKR